MSPKSVTYHFASESTDVCHNGSNQELPQRYDPDRTLQVNLYRWLKIIQNQQSHNSCCLQLLPSIKAIIKQKWAKYEVQKSVSALFCPHPLFTKAEIGVYLRASARGIIPRGSTIKNKRRVRPLRLSRSSSPVWQQPKCSRAWSGIFNFWLRKEISLGKQETKAQSALQQCCHIHGLNLQCWGRGAWRQTVLSAASVVSDPRPVVHAVNGDRVIDSSLCRLWCKTLHSSLADCGMCMNVGIRVYYCPSLVGVGECVYITNLFNPVQT